MTTLQRITCVTLTFVALPAMAGSQQLDTSSSNVARYLDEQGGLSLDEAISGALAREPSIRAARADIDIAGGRRQQAALRANPTVSVEHRAEPAGTDTLTSVGVEWPLELFRRPARVRTAEREVDAVRLAVTNRERLLIAEVRQLYGAAATAIREVAIADELATIVTRQLETVRARVDEGAAPPLERDLLQVELGRIEAERVRSIGRTDEAMVRLKQVLGLAPEEPLRLRKTIESLVLETAARPPSAENPPRDRADVREAEARVAVAEAKVEQARHEGRPSASVFGSYMRMNSGFPQLGFDTRGSLQRVGATFNYVAAGLMVTLPVFNGNQGEITAAQAERSGAIARQEAARLAARAEVAAARARDESAQRAVAMFTGNVRSLARQNLDVAKETFDLGRGTVFDLLSSERRLVEIEQAYAAALREAWDAHVLLLQARGENR
jgi:cobalt-zinc-cadmium efflux system outer membrane protein